MAAAGADSTQPSGSSAADAVVRPALGIAVERRMEYLHPAEFRRFRDQAPIAYLAWGSHEWHGPHLPLGTDTVKAHWMARVLADKTGGVVYPAVYFGFGVMGNPGKDTSLGFPKELMQQVAKHYFLKLYEKGFRVVVVVMGHYGRAHTIAMEEVVKQVEQELAGRLVIVAEPDYTWTNPEFKGDHAAANETSYMELFEPQTVGHVPPAHAGGGRESLRPGRPGARPANASFGGTRTQAVGFRAESGGASDRSGTGKGQQGGCQPTCSEGWLMTGRPAVPAPAERLTSAY